jgi:hypothetical protein
MKKLLIGLALVVLAAPASALAGGWATVGLGGPPDDMGPGDTWNARLTVLQHGTTPLDGLSPTVTIKNGTTSKTFTAKPAGEPGVYVAKVVFPSAGSWSYQVYDDFTQYGGAQTHSFASVSIGTGGAGGDSGGGGFPVLTMSAVIAVALAGAVVLFLLVRRTRVRAPAPTH